MQDGDHNDEDIRRRGSSGSNFLDANNVQRQSIAPSFAPGTIAQSQDNVRSSNKKKDNGLRSNRKSQQSDGAVLNLDDINLRLSENVQIQNSIGKLKKA